MACWKINPPLNSMILPAIHFLWVQDKYIPREYPICGWLYPRIHDQSLIAHDSPQKHNLLLVVIFHLSPKTKGLKYTSSRWWKLPNMGTSHVFPWNSHEFWWTNPPFLVKFTAHSSAPLRRSSALGTAEWSLQLVVPWTDPIGPRRTHGDPQGSTGNPRMCRKWPGMCRKYGKLMAFPRK